MGLGKVGCKWKVYESTIGDALGFLSQHSKLKENLTTVPLQGRLPASQTLTLCPANTDVQHQEPHIDDQHGLQARRKRTAMNQILLIAILS